MHLVGGEGRCEEHVGDIPQVPPGALLDHRAQVDRIDQHHVLVGAGDVGQGGHDVLHGLTVVLPPVAGHQHHLFALVGQAVEGLGGEDKVLPHSGPQGVDHCVAGDEHVLRDPLPAQVLPVVLRGAEVEIRNGRHQLPVHLLRVGGVLVVGPQPRLHVAHRHLMVEGGQGPGKGGGGIPVDQDHVRLQGVDGLVHAHETLAGDGAQGLPGGHDVQVPVRLHVKDLQHAVQHLPVLGRDAADGREPLPGRQLLDQRGHLDGLRPGAEDAHNPSLFHVKSPFFRSRCPPAPRNPLDPPAPGPSWGDRGDSGKCG